MIETLNRQKVAISARGIVNGAGQIEALARQHLESSYHITCISRLLQ
jgi:hypothetical protein